MTIRWSDEMLATLRDMRARGAPVKQCADAVHVSYGTALAKLAHLGINGRVDTAPWKSADTPNEERNMRLTVKAARDIAREFVKIYVQTGRQWGERELQNALPYGWEIPEGVIWSGAPTIGNLTAFLVAEARSWFNTNYVSPSGH